jgi:response regulator of citrate/malate metabolism
MNGLALGATARVMEVLDRETHHRTIAELARSAQVSRQTVRKLIRQLEAEEKLDVSRRAWPNGYLLKPEARHDPG